MSAIGPSMNDRSPDVIAYYDHLWTESYHTIGLDQKKRETFILSEIADLHLANPTILDFGCGMGWLCKALSHVGNVTGIDLSPKGIERAKAESPEVTFVAGDLFEHRFEDEQFDLVVSQEVIEHVTNQNAFLSLVWRYLKPGGYFVMTTPNKTENLNRGYTIEEMRQMGWLQPVENWLTTDDVKAMTQGKFEIQKLTTLAYHRGWRNRIENLLFGKRLSKLSDTLRCTILLHYFRQRMVRDHLLGNYGLYIGMVARKIVPNP